MFFRIIIANFNASEWNSKCYLSILNQSFKDFSLVIVDDMSTDEKSIRNCQTLADQDDRITFIELQNKRWNGGARNFGTNYSQESKYTMFMDCDDWLDDDKCLETIYDTIIQNNYPDCVRLPYKCYRNKQAVNVMLDESNPKDLVNSLYVAPFTKIIKTEKIVLFPENTLIEDVVQHIEQCDNIETVAVCSKPIVVWNRDNVKSISLKENQHLYNSKRISSIYRNIADLMDLQCKHDYCEEHRKWRINCYKNIVRDGKEETF